ncbi:MAG TPA: hypothetical protein VFI49_03315 [Rudaea sp.]|nr:hypothetical protein [Rudaea sp.]
MLTTTAMLLFAGLGLATPPPWLQQPKRFAEVPQAGATFGQSVSIDGDWLVIGAPHESAPIPAQAEGNSADAVLIALDVGKVYLYHRDPTGWQYHSTLTGNQGGAQFGYAVSLHGDGLLVGAPFYDIPNVATDAGKVVRYRLEQNVWTQVGTSVCCSNLGYAVALFGDGINTYAAMGSPADGAGSVAILRRDPVGNEAFETITLPAGLVGGDRFGDALAGESGKLIVGARKKTVGGQANAGIAYVFYRSYLGDWHVYGELAYPNPVSGDYSGYAVAISGDWAAIGAPGRTLANAPTDTGAVQTFVYVDSSGWVPYQELTGASADTDDEFGSAIALQGKHLLIGARDDDSHGGTPNIGSAYFFLRTDGFPVPLWNETEKFMNASPAQMDWFGYGVALSGNTAVVGTPLDATDSGTTLTQAGSITLFVYDQIFANGYD